jgi:RecA/RadA recombinase
MVLRSIDQGGMGKAVAYIDSEGSFEFSRFLGMTRYWGIPEQVVRDNLFVSKVDSFDDVEEAINSIAKLIRKENIGIIVADSIMDPLRSSYPIGQEDLSNLQPRQKHLKRVTDCLKSLAQVHNIISLYTNHVRVSFDDDEKLVPQGGNVLAHASDIRIRLVRLEAEELESFEKYSTLLENSIRVGKAEVVDCGFLANLSGTYLIGSFGIADPAESDKILKQAKEFGIKGYISQDAKGKEISKPKRESKKVIQDIRDKLYS